VAVAMSAKKRQGGKALKTLYLKFEGCMPNNSARA
jgi:hypothetical protein